MLLLATSTIPLSVPASYHAAPVQQPSAALAVVAVKLGIDPSVESVPTIIVTLHKLMSS